MGVFGMAMIASAAHEFPKRIEPIGEPRSGEMRFEMLTTFGN
jgi:hypothetical protein